MLAGLGLGFGILISSMTTKYRNLTVLFTFVVQLWMYGTLKKLTDVSKLHQLRWHHQIEIDEGIHRLYDWYKQGICINHQNV